ncbi:hypothetical protein FIV34_04945 [Luteibacter pinisoli]|uniref:Uncharacterized protein n=1 Tax=Luteibacter pinisoli TaxID=2589080 RepID=A0A4Y5Z2D7_9GAMM|nr:hypothetical protein [Luteibacter pinisoli]QDE38593.1 hypothetical protein FIV34_04945 [Luteibacter pinisoli]
MRTAFALPPVIAAIFLLAACSPVVTYRALSPGPGRDIIAGASAGTLPSSEHLADPLDGEFALALQASAIMFAVPTKPEPVGARPEVSGADLLTRLDEAGATGWQCDARTPAASDDGMDSWPWGRCWDGLTPVIKPHPDLTQIYTGRVNSGLKLELSGSEPFGITSVKSSWTNAAKGIFGRVGGEAASGFALGGPTGAVIAVLLGEGWAASEHTISLSLSPGVPRAPAPNFADLVATGFLCSDGAEKPFPRATPQLLLPVALDTDHSLPVDSHSNGGTVIAGDTSACWHRFPKSDKKYSNGGWLFRFVELNPAVDTSPQGFQQVVPPVYRGGSSENDNKSLGIVVMGQGGHFDGDSKTAFFPVSACHAMKLQIVWWTALLADANGGPAKLDLAASNVRSFGVVIADPHYIQKMRIDKGSRTILIGACGAVASGTAQLPAEDDAGAELSKQVEAVRAAQKKWAGGE